MLSRMDFVTWWNRLVKVCPSAELRPMTDQAEFQRLSSTTCLTPRDKAAVLIRAHKIVVGESLHVILES
jgi:hypothetical protein